MTTGRDHGGGLDAAITRHGGQRGDWLDLSTGINPVPYPVGPLTADAWQALPDAAATEALIDAARTFWSVPDGAAIVPAPGASAIIARLPYLPERGGRAHVPGPTYNEHEAALAASGRWTISHDDPDAEFHVHVHPNNPDGRFADQRSFGRAHLTVIDESFCDVCPDKSLVAQAAKPGVIVLKSFGKFWGLAGLRLGFAIGHPETLLPSDGRRNLSELMGPWPVSGPALAIGTRALCDTVWAEQTRGRLSRDAARLDQAMIAAGARVIGGTDLFRLYDTPSAADWQKRLAASHIWSRTFPYSRTWLRLGLPAPDSWDRLEKVVS